MKPKNFPGRKARRQQRAAKGLPIYTKGGLPMPPAIAVDPTVTDIRVRIGGKRRKAGEKTPLNKSPVKIRRHSSKRKGIR